ncbi:MAG: FAD-dependent monooxygenase [Herbaspirillum sp.]|nr:FAD-dependent monooxygenase [Herbaspirillum sp.]
MHDTSPHDIIIAGAGPVGLLLACELALAGLPVLVLEQASDPSSALKRLPFGMRGLSSPSIEALYRRGLLDAVRARRGAQDPAAATAHWTSQSREAGGHFAGLPFYCDQVDPRQWPYHLDGPCESTLLTEMAHLESVLTTRALALGVTIRRGVTVQAVTQDDDLVSLHSSAGPFLTRWLVGCDGGRSRVRKASGFGFHGSEPEFTGYSARVRLDEPDRLPAGRHYTDGGMYTYQAPGILAMADFDGGACHRREAITAPQLEEVLRRVSGVDVRVDEVELVSTWTDRAFQVDRYRRGRVLLAGDAAHVHSPLGGQGLNLGLGDAMNLGWKLAATVRGDAPPDLLDSYDLERRPVGAQLLAWSRAQVALMRPGPGSRALANVIRALIDTTDGATYLAGRLWGKTLRYPLGDAHALVGCSAPDFALGDGTRLGQHLHQGRGLLLDFKAHTGLAVLLEGWRGRIDILTTNTANTLGLDALLVRPDGVVAWVAQGGIDWPALETATSRWFGAPLTSGGGSDCL